MRGILRPTVAMKDEAGWGGLRSLCAILNVVVMSCVLFFFEILYLITLREKRSVIMQI